MIRIDPGFKIIGHQIQYTGSSGARPATKEEIQLYEMYQSLVHLISQMQGKPVEFNGMSYSNPENWACSRCGRGMIAAPKTGGRSFVHGCIPRQ